MTKELKLQSEFEGFKFKLILKPHSTYREIINTARGIEIIPQAKGQYPYQLEVLTNHNNEDFHHIFYGVYLPTTTDDSKLIEELERVVDEDEILERVIRYIESNQNNSAPPWKI